VGNFVKEQYSVIVPLQHFIVLVITGRDAGCKALPLQTLLKIRLSNQPLTTPLNLISTNLKKKN
jgi:hypothetical protein